MRTVEDILKKTKYTNDDIEVFWTECYIDYTYFAEHVLGYQISEYHKEWYKLSEKFSRLSLQAFRGSGKTYWFIGYMLWKAIFREKFTCLTVSYNYEEAKRLIKLVRTIILDNELLKDFAPESREVSWRATEITLGNGAMFYARTYGEGIRSLRIDLAFFDEAGLYEDKQVYWTAAVPVVQLNRGRIIVVGTPKSPIDLLAELEENDEYYSTKYPSEKDGKPLWIQKYTLASKDSWGRRSLVQVRKEIGELPYQQEYLLIPISRANEVFPMECVMKCLNNSESFLEFGKKEDVYFVGVDLAITAKGDYTVFTVLSANTDGKKLVYAERFRGDLEMQKKKLSFINNHFKPSKIVVDKTGLGEQIFLELQKILPTIRPFHFTAEQKYTILMDLRHEFETFKLSLPNTKKDVKTYNFVQNLVKELQDFQFKADLSRRTKLRFVSGRYDDSVISLALAVNAAKSFDQDYSIRFL